MDVWVGLFLGFLGWGDSEELKVLLLFYGLVFSGLGFFYRFLLLDYSLVDYLNEDVSLMIFREGEGVMGFR